MRNRSEETKRKDTERSTKYNKEVYKEINLRLVPAELERIKAQSTKLGFKYPAQYIKSLIEKDLENN